MKRLLFLAALACLPSYAAPALIGGETNCPNSSGSTPASSISLPVTFTAGHFAILWVPFSPGVTATISSTNQTFTVLPLPVTGGGPFPVTSISGQYTVAEIKSTVSGADTIIVTFGSAITFSGACLMSFSGVDTVVPADPGAGAFQYVNPSSNPQNLPAITTSFGGDLILVMGNQYTSPGITAASGYTQIHSDTQNGSGTSFKIAGAPGSVTPQTATIVNQAVDLFGFAFIATQPSPTAISGLTWLPGPTTITAQWTTTNPGTTQLACGTTMGGPYTLTGLEDNTNALAASHHDIVVSLTVSTQYYCVVTSATGGGSVSSAEHAISTTALAGSTPLTSMTAISTVTASAFGTRYNDGYNASPTPYCDEGDSPWNTMTNGGMQFIIHNDTWSFQTGATCAGSPTGGGSALSIQSLTGTAPSLIRGTQVNAMTSFGGQGGAWKAFDVVSFFDFYNNDRLYMFYSWQTSTFMYGDHEGSNLNISNDLGVTWARWDQPLTFSANGMAPAGRTSNFFGSSNNPIGGATNTSPFSAVTFAKLLPGNTDALLQDQANAFRYALPCGVDSAVDDAAFSNGDKIFLLRVPIAKLANLNPADWQIYKGGGADGNLDSSWTSTNWVANGTPILTISGKAGWCNLQYIPGNNRWLLTNTYYVSPSTSDSWLLGYDMAHPWSTPTQIYTFHSSTLGLFAFIPQQASMASFVSSGNQLTMIGMGDYTTGGAAYSTSKYGPYMATYQLNPLAVTATFPPIF